MKKVLSMFLAAVLLVMFVGCSQDGTDTTTNTQTEGTTTAMEPVAANSPMDPSQMFTDRDRRDSYDRDQAIVITLKGDTVQCDSEAAVLSGNVLTLTKDGTYLISGTWDNGRILVDMDEKAKPQLVLNNAQITSDGEAPLSIQNADKVFITLAEGSSNSLTNGGVYSQQDLTFNGSGLLSITAPAGHGIECKDDLVFAGGSYTISAADHGCEANDSVRITGSDLTITAGKDGIHCENDDTAKGFVYGVDSHIRGEVQGDGISAGSDLQLDSGTYEITTGGGSANSTKDHTDPWGGFMGGGPGGRPGGRSAQVAAETSTDDSVKGLKAAGLLCINGGSYNLNTADDAIHGSSVTINGGEFQIASGDDGVHADEQLTVAKGTITVSESYEGLEGLHVLVSGGTLNLTASDDGINAAGGVDNSGTGGRDGRFGGRPGGPMGGSGNGSITIEGGELQITAHGDGIDANGTLSITGGQTVVTGPNRGDTATLDYDRSGTITGGTFIGTGASGMAQSFSDGNQGVIALTVGQQSEGTTITLADSDGKILLTHTPELPFSVVIISSPEITKGTQYQVTVGSKTGTFDAL